MKNNRRVFHVFTRVMALLLGLMLVWSLAAPALAMDGGNPKYGRKDQAEYDRIVSIRNGNPPKDSDGNPYQKIVEIVDGDQKVVDGVWRGGDARSAISGTKLDNDLDTFADALPSGTVFVDVDKLSFEEIKDDSGAVIAPAATIDIPAGSPFILIKKGNSDPYYQRESDPSGWTSGRTAGKSSEKGAQIAYIGGSKAYLKDVGTATNFNEANFRKGEGFKNNSAQYNPDQQWVFGPAKISYTKGQNIVTPNTGSHLYRITYPGVVTLLDGSDGDLVLTVTKMILETATDIEHGTAPDPTKDQPIVIQSANQFKVYMDVARKDTSDTSTTRIIPAGLQQGNNGRKCWNAMGVEIFFTLHVEEVNDDGSRSVHKGGAVSFSAKDLDLASTQSFWGRKFGPATQFQYNESMAIENGALSYAVVPKYWATNPAANDIPNDLRTGKNGDSSTRDDRKKGWIYYAYDNAKRAPQIIQPLDGRATGLETANGVVFRSDGQWNARRYTGGDFVRGSLSEGANSDKTTTGVGAWIKNKDQKEKDLYLDSNGNPEQKKYERPDDATYDTGFAVLLDSAGASMRWSGSAGSAKQFGGETSQMDTYIFDTACFAELSMSHGTGGGVYRESYSISNVRDYDMREGTVTLGVTKAVVLTLVPEKGYRVRRFVLGNSNGTHEYLIKDLTFVDNVCRFTDPKFSDGSEITVYKNSDGTYDVVLPKVLDRRTLHVDFEADHYFTKVWQGNEPTGDLEFTATPYTLVLNKTTGEYELQKYKDTSETDPIQPVTFTLGEKDAIKKVAGKPTTTWYFKTPALAIEAKGNHNRNHVQRLYWFVTENTKKLPTNWQFDSYSNSSALVPALKPDASEDFSDSSWWKMADRLTKKATPIVQAVTTGAYLSVFENKGGQVVNTALPTYFTFTKEWQGQVKDAIDVTLYSEKGVRVDSFHITNSDGENQKEWTVKLPLPLAGTYYVKETAPSGYDVVYKNQGANSRKTDACYQGGRIVNIQRNMPVPPTPPPTGDSAHPLLWIALAVAACAVLGEVLWKHRKGKS